MESKFPALPTKSTRISRGHVRKLNTSFYPDAFSNKFYFYLQNKLSDSPNFFRTHLSFMKNNVELTTILLDEIFKEANIEK